MKTSHRTHYHSRKKISYNQPAYPNAADNRYFAQKAADILTAILSGMGFMTVMVFFLTLA